MLQLFDKITHVYQILPHIMVKLCQGLHDSKLCNNSKVQLISNQVGVLLWLMTRHSTSNTHLKLNHCIFFPNKNLCTICMQILKTCGSDERCCKWIFNPLHLLPFEYKWRPLTSFPPTKTWMFPNKNIISNSYTHNFHWMSNF